MSMLKTYGRILRQLAPEKNLAIMLVIANLALVGAQFVEPVLFGRIIDAMTRLDTLGKNAAWLTLQPLVIAWVGFGLFSIIAAVTVALHSDRLAHRRRLGVMADFFDHILELPLSFHTSTHSGRLLKVMLDAANGMFFIWLSFFRENCASMVALFVLLPGTLFLNWRLGLILVVLVAFFGVLTAFVIRRTHGLQANVEVYNAQLAERASDVLGNLPVIQSFTRIENESRGLQDIIRLVLSAQMPVLSWWALAAVATRAASTLSLVAIFLVGVWLHLHKLASIGEIVTFMNFATMLIARLEGVVGFINSLFMQAPKIREFFDIMDTSPAIADKPGAIDPGRLRGEVTFDHVTFAYDQRRIAVSDVSFVVKPGETVALVGSTGSGKSTTLSLLHRAMDPNSGAIRIDGIDIRDMKLSALRRNIGVVFQEPMLFARTIEENLKVGKIDASKEEIELALARAQASDFVLRQVDGIKTLVGERGRSLSGGERQRVSIARALLKDPPILVFDEATSALDAATEKQLQAALEAATQGRTTFVIAHRLATIRSANRILVFEQGRIVESGSFDELVAQGGRFAALAKAQFMAGEHASAH
ncbi:glucan ABC transporter ATP-binding protein/ permease [Rhodoblastus acidophilus]|uniref:Glucan ABC transporter ATP-binding protein/ permease n=1 Tax=Rhodoblastus acidophilus TaxID=1074 RepID=A0A6N8DJE5_RHOAC|nr:glucan ABC transporter ATP-binding protein/ permease [Rhodoblastus acidophilus]MCW2274089.1 ATP-binding cassette subfamily B protein [Rhodoblastus acidophilus]MTV30662.1 glucan ABC transporter ATP-binding protein/ permease [Rhodoblastus acidophilus]